MLETTLKPPRAFCKYPTIGLIVSIAPRRRGANPPAKAVCARIFSFVPQPLHKYSPHSAIPASPNHITLSETSGSAGRKPVDYREMHRLAHDPLAVKMLAAGISRTIGADLTESAQEFIERLKEYDGSEPLTTREGEWLSTLRDRSSVSAKLGPYNLRQMIQKAYEARLDLNDEDAEAWIEDLYAMGPEVRLPLSARKRLLFWLRRLGLINGWVDLK
ncbi:MAG: hypothetical protein K0U74_09215 [Alphaproteobacteria bacterium]|nr:hypothetical protein [Alphaproteobacteria bacterium]